MGSSRSRQRNRTRNAQAAREEFRSVKAPHAGALPFAMMGADVQPLRERPPVTLGDHWPEDAQREREYGFLGEAEPIPGAGDADPAMLALLTVAVPLWIERHRAKSVAEIQACAARCADIVASNGDAPAQGKSKRTTGRASDLFNAIAEGLACCALSNPEGVRWCGLEFRADRPPDWLLPEGVELLRFEQLLVSE